MVMSHWGLESGPEFCFLIANPDPPVDVSSSEKISVRTDIMKTYVLFMIFYVYKNRYTKTKAQQGEA